ncbi:MAG TPA: beta-ketoacyl-ACP synthase II [Planctomycetota bacterium]|nr:beta-ketoacyl-ACP synthase II [Planctomycetota bacterium]
MSNNRRRVVVTGLGLVTPVGIGVRTSWNALLEGVSGIGTISLYDSSKHSVHIAGEVKNFDPGHPEYGIDPKAATRMDRFTQLACVAAKEAVKDSGLDLKNEDTSRIGVLVGTGIGGITEIEEQKERLMAKGPGRVSPFLVPKLMGNAAAAQISILHRLRGPNYCIVTACAAGANSLGSALRTIQYGEADVMVSGGSEAAVTPLGMAGFANMGALSARNDDPEGASRPFDKDRNGFVLGEGAGIVVLEELEHARKRGARIYAEFTGYGLSGDGYHITAPCEDGDGGIRAMTSAIKDAGLQPQDIDYINAHGTSTPFNDKIETFAIKKVLGDHARKIPVNSTKSMTGHTLGAAGGIEFVVTCLSIHEGIIHATKNLKTPDPDCDLDYVPQGPRKISIRHALSNSLGFGGHNGTLIVSRYTA